MDDDDDIDLTGSDFEQAVDELVERAFEELKDLAVRSNTPEAAKVSFIAQRVLDRAVRLFMEEAGYTVFYGMADGLGRAIYEFWKPKSDHKQILEDTTRALARGYEQQVLIRKEQGR